MLDTLTPSQLVEWQTVLDELGLDDAWWQAGAVQATVANSLAMATDSICGTLSGTRPKPRKMLKPEVFVPHKRAIKKRQTQQQIAAAALGMVRHG